jgi:hypothetical protein
MRTDGAHAPTAQLSARISTKTHLRDSSCQFTSALFSSCSSQLAVLQECTAHQCVEDAPLNPPPALPRQLERRSQALLACAWLPERSTGKQPMVCFGNRRAAA